MVLSTIDNIVYSDPTVEVKTAHCFEQNRAKPRRSGACGGLPNPNKSITNKDTDKSWGQRGIDHTATCKTWSHVPWKITKTQEKLGENGGRGACGEHKPNSKQSWHDTCTCKPRSSPGATVVTEHNAVSPSMKKMRKRKQEQKEPCESGACGGHYTTQHDHPRAAGLSTACTCDKKRTTRRYCIKKQCHRRADAGQKACAPNLELDKCEYNMRVKQSMCRAWNRPQNAHARLHHQSTRTSNTQKACPVHRHAAT